MTGVAPFYATLTPEILRRLRLGGTPDTRRRRNLRGLLDVVDVRSLKGLRDRTILLLYCDCGFEARFILGLQRENLGQLCTGDLFITEKGTDRLLSEEAAKAMASWLRESKISTGPLLPSMRKDGTLLGTLTVGRWFQILQAYEQVRRALARRAISKTVLGA